MKVVLVILLVLALKSLSKDLPSSFMVCDHFGPNVNECLTKAINSALVQLRNGIPEIDVPSIEPLRSESNITAAKGDVTFTLYNLTMHNVSNTIVTDLKSNITRESFWLTANFSAMDFTAISNYSIHGQLLFFHLDSEGKAVVNFSEYRNIGISTHVTVFPLEETILRASMEGNVVNNRFRLHKLVLKSYPKWITVDLENIIRGQKKLSDDVNKVINDSWDILFSEFEPELDAIVGAIWLEYANNLMSYVPVLLDI
ncbi:hypothetical protein RI129_012474 [Pyrocoelia pectoralis]|uniref:Uncharacterized protein n=1 Tax=Pyrocoelia pectoralis TaxID=417401 RepID=A0AAN7V7B9_9COLE